MRIQYYDINRLTGDQEDALGVRFALFPELLKTSDITTPASTCRSTCRRTTSSASANCTP